MPVGDSPGMPRNPPSSAPEGRWVAGQHRDFQETRSCAPQPNLQLAIKTLQRVAPEGLYLWTLIHTNNAYGDRTNSDRLTGSQ